MNIRSLTYTLRLPVLWLIRLYQNTLSFDHGPLKHLYPEGFCQFYPTCSEYGHQAITKNGLVVGGFKTALRILRCNPWSAGGVDTP